MANLILGVGPSPTEGMIVGEAPGENEEREGEPFVGMSGKLLDEALRDAGLFRPDLFITNAYKLRPPNNRTPTDQEIEEHAYILMEEIERVQPSAILACGNVPLFALTGEKGGITKRRGQWEGIVMPTWHPSFVLRRGGRDTFAASEFFGDVRKFAEVVNS